MTEPALTFGRALVHVLVSALAAWKLGRWSAGTKWRFEHAAVQTAACTAIGLLIVSLSVFTLSLFHAITRPTLHLLYAMLGIIAAISLAKDVWPGVAGLARRPRAVPLLSLLTATAGILYLIWIALIALLPPTSADELLYHLEVPRQVLRAGGAVFLPDNVYAYFPQLGEMLFLFGLAESGELAANFYHVLYGLLLALALYGFCRSYFSKDLSLLAVILFLTVPVVMVILPWAYVDLIFCLYSFLALLAMLQFFKTGRRPWTLLAGVMGGAACATKYTGLQLLLLLVLFTLVEHLTAKRSRWPVGIAGLIMGAIPIALLYPLRNFYFTGWLLFPFQLGNFPLHSGINWDPDRTQLLLRWLSSFGTLSGKGSIWDSLAAPVLVFVRGRFGEARFYDGVIGPVFLLAPISLARGIKNREVKLLYLFSSLFLLYWAFTTRQVRFLLPVLPVLSFLVVSGLTEWRNRAIQVLTIILVMLGLAIGIEQGLKRMREPSPLQFWLGRETRDQYLSRRLDVYAIYKEANHTVGPAEQVYLVDMKNYGYYLNCRWRADFIFEDYSLSSCLDKAAGSGDILDFFRSLEITHLLINEALVTDPTWGLKPRQLALLKSFMHDHASLLARDVYGHALYKLSYKISGTGRQEAGGRRQEAGGRRQEVGGRR